MDWIFNTTLNELASIPAPVAMASLMVWTQSGTSPYAENPERFPVHLGDLGELAQFLGVSSRTLRRYKRELETYLERPARGCFIPSSSWRDPWAENGPKDSKGRPLYIKLDPATVRLLCTLSHHAPAQTAAAAFKVACVLLPELRLRRLRGKAYATAHNGRRYGSRYWSPLDGLGITDKTLAKAFELLRRRGLIVFDLNGKGRRISTTEGAINFIPSVDNLGKTSRAGGQSSDVKPDKLPTPSPYGPRKQENKTPSRTRAREGNGFSDYTIGLALVSALPGLELDGALEIAKHAKTPQDAIEWVQAEWPHLITRDNPAGTFIQMARKGLSRPHSPSGFGQKRSNKFSDSWLALHDFVDDNATVRVGGAIEPDPSTVIKTYKPTPKPNPFKRRKLSELERKQNQQRLAELCSRLGA